jgi:cytochrome c oxidase subunit II
VALRAGLRLLSAAAALPVSGCAGAQSSLAPSGPGAARIADLWWLMLALGALVYVVVLALLFTALLRRRPAEPDDPAHETARATRWVALGGGVIPAVLITALFLVVLRTLDALAPARASLTIQVVGKQWWWEIRYPRHGITTANEIHIPVGEPVHVELTSTDVIHSFWVPRLHGKMDLIPGKTNTIQLHASEAGIYRGQCAEYCGLQHTTMAFLVVALEPQAFAAWLEQQRQPAAEPTDSLSARGRQVFVAAGCAGCHIVRGTRIGVHRGPDLTHLASRRTLAAGTLRNTRGNLAAWVVNAQGVKPGNKMPLIDVRAEDLHALLAYLQGLK